MYFCSISVLLKINTYRNLPFYYLKLYNCVHSAWINSHICMYYTSWTKVTALLFHYQYYATVSKPTQNMLKTWSILFGNQFCRCTCQRWELINSFQYTSRQPHLRICTGPGSTFPQCPVLHLNRWAESVWLTTILPHSPGLWVEGDQLMTVLSSKLPQMALYQGKVLMELRSQSLQPMIMLMMNDTRIKIINEFERAIPYGCNTPQTWFPCLNGKQHVKYSYISLFWYHAIFATFFLADLYM